MYEGRPPKNEDGASLQSVSWADLSARLSAARDLRKALAHRGGERNGEGSFDAASARWIADHSSEPEADEADGKRDVNHDDLANLKTSEAMLALERALPRPAVRVGDRGRE